MIRLKSYAAKTNQGPYLQVNEDDFEVDLVNNLFLVCDGIGGSGIGDLYANNAKKLICEMYLKIGGDPDATMPFFYSPRFLVEGNALINSFHRAHQDLIKMNSDREMGTRGAVAITGIVLSENLATIASVGNCSAYLYRNGHLDQLVSPESLKCLARDSFEGYLSSASTNGLGLFNDLIVNAKEIKVQEGDLLAIFSDGVYSRLKFDEIKHLLERSNKTHTERIDDFFHLSNQRGNLDNQTGIILEF